MNSQTKKIFNILLLTLACAIWGMGFVGTRWTLTDYSPLWSNSLRFVFAGALALIFIIIYRFFVRHPFPTPHGGVIITGTLLLISLGLQTMGIEKTTLAKSGFLTTLYAVFTPLLLLVFKRKILSLGYWINLMLAQLGIALLCDLSLSNFNEGDFYITLSAVGFSLQILALDHYVKNADAFLYNCWQCFYMGVMGFFYGWAQEGLPQLSQAFHVTSLGTPSPFWGFIILAFFSSIIAFGIQAKVQKSLSPQVVSVIFLMESLFAAFFGYLFFHEKLSILNLAGCILILWSVYRIGKSEI
jgi:drug/metabolite transporter (DMT)-like permease